MAVAARVAAAVAWRRWRKCGRRWRKCGGERVWHGGGMVVETRVRWQAPEMFQNERWPERRQHDLDRQGDNVLSAQHLNGLSERFHSLKRSMPPSLRGGPALCQDNQAKHVDRKTNGGRCPRMPRIHPNIPMRFDYRYLDISFQSPMGHSPKLMKTSRHETDGLRASDMQSHPSTWHPSPVEAHPPKALGPCVQHQSTIC